MTLERPFMIGDRVTFWSRSSGTIERKHWTGKCWEVRMHDGSAMITHLEAHQMRLMAANGPVAANA